MKLAAALAALLLVQTSSLYSQQSAAVPQHLRYLRNLSLPADSSGPTCIILDADTFAHTASRSADDLRLFTSSGLETPFALTESEAQPQDTATAQVLHPKIHNGILAFDLAMPPRPYSRVDLQLAAHDFYATVIVTGLNPHGHAPTYLGRFALFDLTQQHLSRSTTLLLPESSFAQIHIELQLWKLPRASYPNLTPSILQTATVPPSREAQTLFTTVSQTSRLDRQQHRSVATFRVPAHTPIERIAFTLTPNTFTDFLRHVTITATPDDPSHSADIETATGDISSIELPLYLDADREATTVRNLHIDTTLAANLRSPATIDVAIDGPTVPLQSVQLQMRQRTLCFNAAPNTTYQLLYGDDQLPPPVYNDVHVSQPATATLGAEQINPTFTPRADTRPYTQRHPEILWIALLAAITLLAATARHNTHHQGRKS